MRKILRSGLLLLTGSALLVFVNIVMVDFLRFGFAQYNNPSTGQYQPNMMQPGGMQQVPGQMPGTLVNNAALPNFGGNTYSTATGEVRVPFQADTSRMMAFSVVVDDEWQMITMIDPVNQSIAVYRIALKGGIGTCQLRSVRNISADLKFYNYNGVGLQPEEVQAILDSRNKQ